MSSVPKHKRKESSFQVFETAKKLRKELTTYILRDFAIDGKLYELLEEIRNELSGLGLELNEKKTVICRIDRPFKFMQNNY